MARFTRGRPARSIIRDNLAKILFVVGECYGYRAFLIYRRVFGPVSIRSIYYNLDKGVLLEEFEIVRTERAEGTFSWGKISDRNYYALKRRDISISEDDIIRIKSAMDGPAGN